MSRLEKKAAAALAKLDGKPDCDLLPAPPCPSRLLRRGRWRAGVFAAAVRDLIDPGAATCWTELFRAVRQHEKKWGRLDAREREMLAAFAAEALDGLGGVLQAEPRSPAADQGQ